jgi:glycosyltransferase involved in cell wall biosynthesis
MPTFSVIIPTFNRQSLLARAVASVLCQTFSDFELLIVDDGSAAGSVRLEEANSLDPRVRIIRLAANQGVSAARNAGIQSANGEFIAFLDDDDTYRSVFLESAIAAFSEFESDVAVGWSPPSKILESLADAALTDPRLRGDEVASLALLQSGAGCGLVVKASFLSELGLFNEQLRFGEDTEYFVRILAKKLRVAAFESDLVKISEGTVPRLSLSATAAERRAVYEWIRFVYSDFLMHHPLYLSYLTPDLLSG